MKLTDSPTWLVSTLTTNLLLTVKLWELAKFRYKIKKWQINLHLPRISAHGAMPASVRRVVGRTVSVTCANRKD